MYLYFILQLLESDTHQIKFAYVKDVANGPLAWKSACQHLLYSFEK